MWRLGFILAAFACSMHAACITVDQPQLLARDLAKADPAFATLDPNLVFSYAPSPGKQRFVPATELDKWAADHGLGNVQSSSACFERAAAELRSDDVAAAIKRTLGSDIEGLQVAIVDLCPCRVPLGQLQFPWSGASAPPPGHPEVPVLWRGQMVAADGTSYPVWARLRVIASVHIVRAASSLRQHQTLTEHDLEEAVVQDSPLRFRKPASVLAFAGKVMTVSISRGAILAPEFVRNPDDIERGSLVAVDVVNGAARIALQARAETAGNTGQIVTLINPAGAARFHASVMGPGRAQIVLSPMFHEGAVASDQNSQASGALANGSF